MLLVPGIEYEMLLANEITRSAGAAWSIADTSPSEGIGIYDNALQTCERYPLSGTTVKYGPYNSITNE